MRAVWGVSDWDMSEDRLLSAGADGWELAAVVPRSSTVSGITSGITDEELWIFKRPVSE